MEGWAIFHQTGPGKEACMYAVSEENVDFVKWLKSRLVERALGRIEKLLALEFMMVGTDGGRSAMTCRR